MNEDKKNIKTYWPIGILLIIAMGVVLLFFLVSISKQQSIAPDNSYNASKLIVDSNINNYLEIQKEFESNFLPFVGVNKNPDFDDVYKIYTPYFTKRTKIASTNNKDYLNELHKEREIFTLSKENNKIFLHFKEIKNDLIIKTIKLEFDSLETKTKKRDGIVLILEKTGNNIFSTQPFALPKTSAYHGTFIIEYQNKKLDSKNPTNTKIIFYKKVFFNIQS